MAVMKRLRFWILALCVWGIIFAQGQEEETETDRVGHCYEKLALWEYYNIAVAFKGLDQKYIACPYKKGGQDRTGQGKDGRLTFQRFMDILGKRTDGKGLCTVKEPTEGKETEKGKGKGPLEGERSYKTVALELLEDDFDGRLDFNAINRQWVINYDKKKNAEERSISIQDKTKQGRSATESSKDPPQKITDKIQFRTFFEWISDMASEAAASTDPEVRREVEARLKNLKELSSIITEIRQLELDERILKDIQDTLKRKGGGLTKDEVVENEKRTSKFSNYKYSSLDVDATLRNIKDPTRRAKASKWLREYGTTKPPKLEKNAKKEDLTIEEAAFSHVDALACWKNQDRNLKLLLGEHCSPD